MDVRDGHRRAHTLAKQAQDAGLVVTRMAPRWHHGRWEFDITLWRDGSVWAEATHETVDSVLNHIATADAQATSRA